ncbi:hypothetical protein Mmc1_2245 [Magnetococcus marinus MC-1]|uniref:Uncharacterized protein n=1 Tax=Magnetococcus marinus (strain ATCC BAA-1437 / JCM 17883 / MC-1) TaxID=156889 RepID=A0L9V3_MAGMM|nr:hypothetical protein [Magnetococcus marinus]ABK44746.1 hypothetical protein Mmc1_2245 [Magnetococcus marinus MC-1]
MLFLLPLGLSASIGVGLAYYIANRDAVKPASSKGGLLSRFSQPTPPDMEIEDEVFLDEKTVTLASEEIVLDNRFGNHSIYSEHDFIRSADIKLEFTSGKDFGLGSQSRLLRVLEYKANQFLSQRLGGRAGSQIERRVHLRLVAERETRAIYRIHWKQSSCRGLFVVRIGDKKIELPYMASYGLFHEVESIKDDG